MEKKPSLCLLPGFSPHIFLNPDPSLLKGISDTVWLFMTCHCLVFFFCAPAEQQNQTLEMLEFPLKIPCERNSDRRSLFAPSLPDVTVSDTDASLPTDKVPVWILMQETRRRCRLCGPRLHRQHRAFRLLICWSSGETNAADSCYISICLSSTEICYVHLH